MIILERLNFLLVGSIENINSLTNKYAPKRLNFDKPAFQARVRVAVLDNNENTGRPILLGKLTKF